ncbi:MAG: AEC family transporter [Dictyoglomus sp.]|nr:AEC family transporter [Dictyoglomus sp.]MCX7941508.1 AEC family transporter [Dictyoglomaceae bacterium]MDW8188857.1 AEC family transporter [Dictyoglomus sp.]
MIEKIIINILIILFGFLIKKTRILPENTGKVLSRFIVYITLPATILKVFLTTKIQMDFIILPISSLLLGLSVFLLSFFILRSLNFEEKIKWTLLISLCGYNVGLFAYPFIQSICGDEGLFIMAMFDIGNSFLVFGLAYAVSLIAVNQSKIDFYKIIKNVILFFPLDIYIISIILNLFNIKFPSLLYDFVSQLSMPNNVLALFTIGFFLDFNLNTSELKALTLGLILRVLPGILFSFIIFYFFPSNLISKIISIGLLLPAPLVAILYSSERNLNVKLASLLVSLTIITGVISIFFIMKEC